MPVGTIHWLPWRAGRGRPLRLTRLGLQLAGFFIALLMCLLVGGAYLYGRQVGRSKGLSGADRSTAVLEAELYQLRARTEELTGRLIEIAEREQRILTAGAGLNMDFSGLFPNLDTPADHVDGLFEYIDGIDLQLLLAERLAEAELAAYDSLASHFVRITEQLRRVPSIWPSEGYYVSDFGPRIDPFTGAVRYHDGIDIAERAGTPIYAPADGTVVFCGWSSGYGLTVIIRHTPRLSTRFAHCSSICVSVGQPVQRGDLIARIGMTGRAVGPHLHYEVLVDGMQVDPDDFIIKSGFNAAVF